MHFNPTILLASLAALTLTQAGNFSIGHLPSGGYILSMDEHGNQITETIDPAKYRGPSDHAKQPSASAKFRARTDSNLSPRTLPGPKVTCRNNGPYGHDDIGVAGAGLRFYCDSGNKIPGRGSVAFVSGQAVWYACSNGGQNPCSSEEFWEANGIMDAECGAWTDINLYIGDWAKTYGRDTIGHIC
jgi:hypothetical protein